MKNGLEFQVIYMIRAYMKLSSTKADNEKLYQNEEFKLKKVKR